VDGLDIIAADSCGEQQRPPRLRRIRCAGRFYALEHAG
jgi:hypothetical protein